MIRQDLVKNGFDERLRGGLALTGGGAQMDGLLEIAEQIFDCSVRYGLPDGLGGLVDVIGSPAWATASGLLIYGNNAEQSQSRSGRRRSSFSMRGMVSGLRGMFSDLL
jgi:cell division protein FtsA